MITKNSLNLKGFLYKLKSIPWEQDINNCKE